MVVDSMPIMTSTGRNCVGKLDMEITDKGYCSTKNMYYHGLNQHLVGYRRKGGGRSRSLSAASENDLSVFKRECAPAIKGKTIFADKIYRDSDKMYGNIRLTPVKSVKGVSEHERQRSGPLTNCILRLFLPSENLWRPFSVGLTKIQTFKELIGAGPQPDS